MFIIRTLVDMSGMAVLYAYHIQVRELQMKFEVDTLQNIFTDAVQKIISFLRRASRLSIRSIMI